MAKDSTGPITPTVQEVMHYATSRVFRFVDSARDTDRIAQITGKAFVNLFQSIQSSGLRPYGDPEWRTAYVYLHAASRVAALWQVTIALQHTRSNQRYENKYWFIDQEFVKPKGVSGMFGFKKKSDWDRCKIKMLTASNWYAASNTGQSVIQMNTDEISIRRWTVNDLDELSQAADDVVADHLSNAWPDQMVFGDDHGWRQG